MQEEIAKIDTEIEPFLENGKVTTKTKLKWLEFRSVISIVDNEIKVRPDDPRAEKLSFKKYQDTEKLLETYLNAKERIRLGKMGTDKIISDEINGEEIPF